MTRPIRRNLYDPPKDEGKQEVFETLLQSHGATLERIVSTGQATPEGEWLEQASGEWVVLLTGQARLSFEGHAEPLALAPGDYVYLPPRMRHRVDWTDPHESTVWLALHLDEPPISLGAP